MKKFPLISVLLLLTCCHFKSKEGNKLPSFDLLLSDSVTRFNTDQITEGKPIILMYFSPDCEHCQQETEGLLHHMDSLKEVKFIFFTNDPINRLEAFNKYYKIYNYPNIILGQDYRYFFPGHFKGAFPPYLVIYNQYKRERAIFSGEASTIQIISFINNL